MARENVFGDAAVRVGSAVGRVDAKAHKAAHRAVKAGKTRTCRTNETGRCTQEAVDAEFQTAEDGIEIVQRCVELLAKAEGLLGCIKLT